MGRDCRLVEEGGQCVGPVVSCQDTGDLYKQVPEPKVEWRPTALVQLAPHC